MVNLFLALGAAGAGWLLGTLGTRKVIDERIDQRLRELQNGAQAAAGVKAAAAPQAPVVQPAAPAPAPAAPASEEISPEILTVITAAICAFLGKPARIRRIRRVQSGNNPWAQVGRVSVMASHALTRQH